MNLRSISRRAAAVIVAAAMLLLVGCVVHLAIDVRRNGETADFTYFYGAAKAMLAGQDIYAETAGRYLYPPFLAFILQPLALISEPSAAVIWAALSAVFFAAAASIASRQASQRWKLNPPDLLRGLVPGALALLLFGEKIHGNFMLGQSDTLTLLGFAGALALMDSRPVAAGVVVGAAANVKYLSLIFVPYFVLKRNYRAAIASLVSFAFFLILPVIEIGFARLGSFLVGAAGGLGRMMSFTVPGTPVAKVFRVYWHRSISATSAIFRFTRAHHLPDAVAVITLGCIAAAFLVTLILVARRFRMPLFGRTRERALATLEWSVMIVVALVFSPQTTARHMIMLLLVFIVAIAVVFAQVRTRARTTLLATMALTLVGLSFPWRALGLRGAMNNWRIVSGVSWLVLLSTVALVWCGCSLLARRRQSPVAPNTP